MSHTPSERPETADDAATATGAREPVVPQLTPKQSQRLRTPISAMVVSMIALLGITLPFVWLQPRPDNQSYRPEVDLVQTADQASADAGFPVLAPDLQEPWHTNFARWTPASADAVPYWEFGMVTPSSGFLTVTQTDRADPTWLAERLEKAPETGTLEAGGTEWERHSATDGDSGETTLSLVGKLAGTTVVVAGQGTEEEFSEMAEALAQSAQDRSDHSGGSTGSGTAGPSATASPSGEASADASPAS